MIRVGALVALAACVAASAAAAPAGQPHATTRAALAALARQGSPGVVVLFRNGSSTSVLVSGVADTKTRAPMGVADHFRIGSITKSFVATVVLQLVAEKKLSLSDTLGKRLPGLVPNGRRITVQELLQHRSGLYNYTDDPHVLAPYDKGDLGHVWTPRQLVGYAVRHPTFFPPGTKWTYSNTNYILLGLIVEAVMKDTLADQLDRRIFRPLGLRQTSFAVGRRIAAPAAHGYADGRDVSTYSGSVWWAAAAIASTAGDVARFYSALLGGRLLPSRELKEMESTTPVGLYGYGLGLQRIPTSCGDAWGHKGIVPGYTSFGLSSADGKHQIVLLATTTEFPNPESFGTVFDRIAITGFCD